MALLAHIKTFSYWKALIYLRKDGFVKLIPAQAGILFVLESGECQVPPAPRGRDRSFTATLHSVRPSAEALSHPQRIPWPHLMFMQA